MKSVYDADASGDGIVLAANTIMPPAPDGQKAPPTFAYNAQEHLNRALDEGSEAALARVLESLETQGTALWAEYQAIRDAAMQSAEFERIGSRAQQVVEKTNRRWAAMFSLPPSPSEEAVTGAARSEEPVGDDLERAPSLPAPSVLHEASDRGMSSAGRARARAERRGRREKEERERRERRERMTRKKKQKRRKAEEAAQQQPAPLECLAV